MVTHPFRAASESGASPEQFAALFAPDVTFHTPILTKPLSGKAVVLPVLAYAIGSAFAEERTSTSALALAA